MQSIPKDILNALEGITVDMGASYFSALKEFSPFSIQFTDDLDINWQKIDRHQELQLNIYRIIQELTTNAIKYAHASELDIQMMNEANKFVLIYEDNGVGIQEGEEKNKFQFNTIRKRVQMFNGKFEVNSQEGKGMFVMISLPLKIININA